VRVVLLAGVLVCTTARAASVGPVQVQRHGDRFHIDMRIVVAAPAVPVFAALQEYRQLPRFNPEVQSVRVIPEVPGRVRLYTVVRSCVLFFCKTLHQWQLMTASASADGGDLAVQMLPGGDFKQGDALWRVHPCPQQPADACIHATLDLRPAFWVPPLIGAWIVRQKMQDEAQATGDALQREARLNGGDS